MNLLEGIEINTENKEDMGNEDKREGQRGEREEQEIGSGMELEEEEIAKAVTKIKMKKAGTDGIHMQAWRYGEEEIKNRLVEVLRKIWTEGQIPEEWKTNIIIPLYKRRDQEKVGNYRGISLLCSAYKIYAEILRNRLEEELGEKNLVPESQAGFRKGKSTIDNTFILNYIAQRERERREGNQRRYTQYL